MEKGILYLACTAILLAVGLIEVSTLNNQIVKTCSVRVVAPSVAPTIEPTATPSAALKSSVRVSAPVNAVKTVAPTK